jgi:hypothetical protein
MEYAPGYPQSNKREDRSSQETGDADYCCNLPVQTVVSTVM